MTLDQDDIDAIIAAVTTPLAAVITITGGAGGNATANTFRLQGDASATDNYYVGLWLRITAVVVGSSVGVGQVRLITAYNGTTKDATVYPPWTTIPSSAVYTYSLYPAAWVGGSVNAATGARSVTLTVNDGAAVLESARVRVFRGSESYVLSTDVTGVAAFSLDDGTWTVSITLPGYQFTPTTLVVSATTAHAYTMAVQTFTPSDPDKVTGTLIAYSSAGVGTAGIEFSIIANDPASTTGLGLSGATRTIISGTNGATSFTNLFPGVTYTISRGDTDRKYVVEIPAGVDTDDAYPLPSVIGAP